MSSGHASEEDFASAESEAEDSGEGGSIDEQVVEGAGVGCDEGVGFDEGEETHHDASGRLPKEGDDDEGMQEALPPSPVLVHADGKEGSGLTQQEEEVGQGDGSERDESGKVKKDADEEGASKEKFEKDSTEVKQEASYELQQSSTAVKDEQRDTASGKQVQDDLPEQEMDRRVEVLCAIAWANLCGVVAAMALTLFTVVFHRLFPVFPVRS